jgi:hypothetical protein
VAFTISGQQQSGEKEFRVQTADEVGEAWLDNSSWKFEVRREVTSSVG